MAGKHTGGDVIMPSKPRNRGFTPRNIAEVGRRMGIRILSVLRTIWRTGNVFAQTLKRNRPAYAKKQTNKQKKKKKKKVISYEHDENHFILVFGSYRCRLQVPTEVTVNDWAQN